LWSEIKYVLYVLFIYQPLYVAYENSLALDDTSSQALVKCFSKQ